MTSMRIAIVLYEGVLGDECDAFESVLGFVEGAEVVTTAAHAGFIDGTHGGRWANSTFDTVDARAPLDVVIVPGGLGAERAATDAELMRFLHRIGDHARYIAASSTGSVVLAAAGLLQGRNAATHWLATDLLRRFGSDTDGRRLVVSGKVVTCEGRISAVDAAFTIAERIGAGDDLDRIQQRLLEQGEPWTREPNWWERIAVRAGYEPAYLRRLREHDARRSRLVSRTDAHGGSPASGDAFGLVGDDDEITPLTVMFELVNDDKMVRRMRRNARRIERSSDRFDR